MGAVNDAVLLTIVTDWLVTPTTTSFGYERDDDWTGTTYGNADIQQRRPAHRPDLQEGRHHPRHTDLHPHQRRTAGHHNPISRRTRNSRHLHLQCSRRTHQPRQLWHQLDLRHG